MQQAAKLRELIEALDPDSLPSIVHLARSLDDGDVVDALLEGATWDERRIEPGTVLREALPRHAHHHARMATLALIATGIGRRASEMRAVIDRVQLTHTYADHRPYHPATPIDVELLIGLPLRTLRVSGLEILHPERLAELRLETLIVDSIQSEHLRELSTVRTLMTVVHGDVVPTLPACEELQLNANGSLRIEDQPRLLTLTTWNTARVRLREAPLLHRAELTQARELIADAPLPALRHLNLGGVIQTPDQLIALEHLRTRSIESVADLPRLRRLELESSVTTLAGLRGMQVEYFRGPDKQLKTLEGYPRSKGSPHRKLHALRSLKGIDVIRDIETLELRSVRSLEGIEAHRDGLRGLDIRDCPVRDVRILEGFDLRAILIAGTPLKPSDFPESLRWALVTARESSVTVLAMRERP